VDPETIDENYAQLEQQGQQTAALIQALADKLQAAADAGDSNAREWMLDLKQIALGVQQEEGQTTLLLQSIHSMVDNHVQAAAQPSYQQPQSHQRGGGTSGMGALGRFLGGGFGRAIMSGAGFGISNDLVNKIFQPASLRSR
jgi:hypothetical protein